MNRIIYYLMIFLFFVGIAIGITNNILDVMFVIAGAIVYMITFFLYKTINQKFVVNFYSMIAIIFIVAVALLLWKYGSNIDKNTITITLITFILILASHKLIIYKLNWWFYLINLNGMKPLYCIKGREVFYKKLF